MLRDTLLYLAQNQRLHDFVVQNRVTRNVSRRFVAGETLEEAVQVSRALNQRNLQVALDYLGENVTLEKEAAVATQNYLAALDLIKQTQIDANISIKLTALGLDISQEVCEYNLRSLLEQARRYSIFVCVDMESSAYTERTLALVLRMHEQFEHIGTVLQSYLYRSQKDAEQLIERRVRIRLVKGAYKEPAALAFQKKREVDQSYERLMTAFLSRGTYPALATHDPALITFARQFGREHNIAASSFEFQMLYGIRRDLQEELVRQGYSVRVYVPYGSHWYPYLMRRMAERPANLAFVMSNSLR